MDKASEELRYEDAARYRDQLNAIDSFMKKQKKVSLEKNSLILISILTQIIALLALLFLFRNLLKSS